MPRRGKDLERLIELLEKLIGKNSQITVTSPEILRDKITGGPREVDVAIRAKLGSTEILVIIECRDREATQDCTWIEQLTQKREDVGANKAVAVSTSGFSDEAKIKAKAKGIDLRTLDEVTIQDLASWCQVSQMTSLEHRHAILQARINCINDSDMAQIVQCYAQNTLAAEVKFRSFSNNEVVSVHNIITSLDKAVVYKNVTPNGPAVTQSLQILADDKFAVIANGTDIKIHSIGLVLSLSITLTMVPLVFHQYKDGDVPVVDIASAELTCPEGKKLIFSIVKDQSSGNISILTRPKPEA
jgi:hypothetical protein